MKELYLLTILDGLNDFLVVLAILGGILGGVGLFAYIMYRFIEREEHPTLKKWGVTLVCIAFTCGFANVFVPTTKQAMMIYGVGTVVDYVQTNEDIKQLPDKCIQALDMWVDNCIEEQQKK
jgi:uncharacterized membrane protein